MYHNNYIFVKTSRETETRKNTSTIAEWKSTRRLQIFTPIVGRNLLLYFAK
jgi:hypothetical protein